MSLGSLLSVVSILAMLFLGVVVYRRNPRSATHILFGLLCADLILWGVAQIFSVRASTEVETLFWIRAVMVSVVPQVAFFYLLMKTFPRATLSINRYTLISLSFVSLSVLFLAASPLVFSGIDGVGSIAKPIPGPAILIFGIFTVGMVLAGVYELLRKNLKAQGLEQRQMRYLLFGVVGMFALLIFLIFFNILVFKDPSFVSYASVFTLPFVVSTAYSITRYRMMDIRFLVVRSVFFSVIVGTFFLLYGVIVWLATTAAALQDVVLTPAMHALAAVIVTSIAIVGFQWYRRLLEQLTNRVFFKAQYDTRQALIDLGRQLTETIDINRIQELLTTTLRATVKVEKVIVFLRDTEKKVFRPSGGTEALNTQMLLKDGQPLVRHLKHTRSPIVRDELPLILERQDPQHDAEEIKEMQTTLSWLDVAVVLPLIVKGELTGLLFLGDKLAGDPFSAEDLELLTIVAPQAATALENARLYQQAAEFGRTLQREVTRATGELRVANEQLSQLDKAKSEFLSIASHQLYTPLTALKGYLSMVQEGDYGRISTKQRPVMDILRQSSDRLIDLIKNLLDVSRIESGRLELSLESIDLATLARDLVKELIPNAERKKLALVFHDPAGALPHVVADTQRLRQVLLNTVDNAIKYTDQGAVTVRVVQDKDTLVYSVQDTGKGIARDEIDRLFTKFTRVGGAHRYNTEGTGLGLYVARQIVREHHGDIWVESPGVSKGSTFFMRLPIEGSPESLKAGTKVAVGIKAAEVGEQASGAPPKAEEQPAKPSPEKPKEK